MASAQAPISIDDDEVDPSGENQIINEVRPFLILSMPRALGMRMGATRSPAVARGAGVGREAGLDELPGAQP